MHLLNDDTDNPQGTPVVLASASPRRRELLEQLGVRATVSPADIDESTRSGETPIAYVERLACEKSRAVADTDGNTLVIGADTTISHAGLILGKPENAKHAFDMLSALSGQVHQVHTGVAVTCGETRESCVVTTRVEFRPISSEDIEKYVATEEPFGKAGAYAIQGIGAMLINKIEGSYSNVVGLPLAETAALMKRFGYCVLSQRRARRSGK